jgi:uncharacterized RDD family membrane protein YckC
MHADVGGTLEIRTAEGVTFSLRLAGPSVRFLAWLIDLCVLGAMTSAVSSALGGMGTWFSDHIGAVLILVYFLLQVGYPIVLEWYWRGQTLGKRLMRLRVMDAQGLNLQFGQVAVRNLLRVVDALPQFYLVGAIAMFISRYNQRLGDLAANTVVVRAPEALAEDFERVITGKYNSFREYPHIEARLRQQVTPEEAALAVQALLRRNQLEPAKRIALYRDLAKYFKEAAKFPEIAILGLTDEQYLRNVVDSVFRERRQRETPGVATEQAVTLANE